MTDARHDLEIVSRRDDLGEQPREISAGRSLGQIVSGSLTDGLEARLAVGTSVEDMAVGRYVVVNGAKRRFFGMITDVKLSATNPQLTLTPPDLSDPFIAEVFAGTATFGMIDLMPMLTIDEETKKPQPVRTIPSHYSPVNEASERDVSDVFGTEDEHHFYVGQPIDMETPVCIDLRRFVERSSGVFGKSGTGKTFLTRLLLVGIVQKEAAVNLVFDMHNEYGFKGSTEGPGDGVKGLKALFPGRVAIFTLDEKSSRQRGISPDFVVEIGYDQIEAADFELLQEALGLTSAQVESIHALVRIFGEKDWLARFVALETSQREELAEQHGLKGDTLNVLNRHIQSRILRLPFIKEKTLDNSVKRILDSLQNGTHVVLEFGSHDSFEAYILVANILTRRIHAKYVELSERAMGLGDKTQRPRPLVITIEEAHKFLNPKVADLTIFGKIAREMRKYNVTLLVVDQRPSGISDEIMSQIGTRISCLLDDEKDTAAVLSGISGSQALRGVLARLDPKQQAIILGYAVPMPVVIRTRDYGTEEFYAAVTAGNRRPAPPIPLARSLGAGDEPGGLERSPRPEPAIRSITDIWGPEDD